jgi:hypothetical protein
LPFSPLIEINGCKISNPLCGFPVGKPSVSTDGEKAPCTFHPRMKATNKRMGVMAIRLFVIKFVDDYRLKEAIGCRLSALNLLLTA